MEDALALLEEMEFPAEERPNAVTTVSLAKELRAWLAKGGPDDDMHTVAWLERQSGVSKRVIRRILSEGCHTTKEETADRLMSAIDRLDLFHTLEFVVDGRAAKARRTGCVSPAAPRRSAKSQTAALARK
jgi:hypothetical protein